MSSNVVPFPKLTADQITRHYVLGITPTRRHADHYLDLDRNYECRVIPNGAVMAGKCGRLNKDDANARVGSSDHLLLNVLRPDGRVAASLIVNASEGHVDTLRFDPDELMPEDTAAVARLLAKKSWSKTYRIPQDTFLFATDGRSYSFRNMPTSLTIRGELIISNADNLQLPGSLAVLGNVFIGGSNVSRAPSYLMCGSLQIVDSWMSTIASVLKVEELKVSHCAIEKLCGIGNISGNATVTDGHTSCIPPSALRVGGDLTISKDSLTHLHSGITVMGKIIPQEPGQPFPWSTDFLGRAIGVGDFVKILDCPKFVRNGKEIAKPLAGFCARFMGADKKQNAVLSIENDGYPMTDRILVTSQMILKVDPSEYAKHRISYVELEAST